MAGQAKRAQELKQIAELVADVLTEYNPALYAASDWRELYRPTILDGAMADAFDHAMARAGCPVRAWRGSAAERAVLS